MGGPVFDRQVFVKQKQNQPPPSRSPLPGALVLVVVAGLAAFATYRYVKAGGGAPSNPADKAQIEQLQKKLKAVQAHVEELEKKRRVKPVNHVAAKVKPEDAKPAIVEANHAQLADVPPRPAGHATGDVHHSATRTAAKVPGTTDKAMAPDAPLKASPSAVKPLPLNSKTLLASNQSTTKKQLTALQNNLNASHQEWQATVNRLGNVVGQLDSQQSAIQRTQTGVNYLLERVQRSDISFTLRKGSGLQHVGPISMELASTSVKGQHYSIRMMVDDKSVELKDRALNEIVQFYTSRSKYPLRLIVSQIGRGKVSGTLAVPTGLNEESSPHELQER